jgi:hypothetical protein
LREPEFQALRFQEGGWAAKKPGSFGMAIDTLFVFMLMVKRGLEKHY